MTIFVLQSPGHRRLRSNEEGVVCKIVCIVIFLINDMLIILCNQFVCSFLRVSDKFVIKFSVLL